MALINKLNAIGDAIREKTGGTEKLTLDAMPAEILAIVSGGGELPEEAFNLTGDCQYKFNGGGWDWFVEMYGSRITTEKLSAIDNMFNGTKLTKIPFDLNCNPSAYVGMANLFQNASKLTDIPKITGQPSTITYIFSGCYNLRELKEEAVAGLDWSYHDNSTSQYNGNTSNRFSNCHSLRKYPNSFLAHGNPVGNYVYSNYRYLFQGCYVLDEIVDLPIQHRNAKWTSNAFNNAFQNCGRLKRLTFETNEDGSPIVINDWSKQIIDLTSVGFASSDSNIKNYNSGISMDKKVSDDSSYAALKDDPDWFTLKADYSRYNHTSAVETINSLPDVSAKTGNTINFKGAAGAKTDGGAINTLTEAEIAVATAKGWTVTLV